MPVWKSELIEAREAAFECVDAHAHFMQQFSDVEHNCEEQSLSDLINEMYKSLIAISGRFEVAFTPAVNEEIERAIGSTIQTAHRTAHLSILRIVASLSSN